MLHQAWIKGAFQIITSQEQLEELTRVLGYKKLERFINPDEAKTLLENLKTSSEIAKELPEITASPDPDDNLIIATACGRLFPRLIGLVVPTATSGKRMPRSFQVRRINKSAKKPDKRLTRNAGTVPCVNGWGVTHAKPCPSPKPIFIMNL
jgi:hypothetical protein